MRRSYVQALMAMFRSAPSDACVFLMDVLRALPHGMGQLHGELIAWHRTVQVHQDPQLLQALLAPLDESSIVEVFPPGL